MRRFTVCDAEQRTPAWHQARLGRLTGSRAADMLATVKSGEAAARRDYRLQLVCERLTGHVQEEPYVNAAMQRGITCEPMARAAYEALTGELLTQTGVLLHTDVMAGCSLDGHVDDFAGIVEIKCPKSATHLRYLRARTVPAEYLPQITHNLWVTGADWCDFMSWDDRFPAELQTVRVRVHRDDLDLAAYEAKALAFLAECEADLAAVRGLVKEYV